MAWKIEPIEGLARVRVLPGGVIEASGWCIQRDDGLVIENGDWRPAILAVLDYLCSEALKRPRHVSAVDGDGDPNAPDRH